MIHILISLVLKRLLEISDRYCFILVISYYRPAAARPSNHQDSPSEAESERHVIVIPPHPFMFH